MRKFDKLYNLQKANLLSEQRYLESKGFIEEEIEPKRGDEIVWIAPPKQIDRLVRLMTGAKGEYLGREGGEEVVSFNGRNFYTSRGTFELTSNIGNNQNMNNVSSMINHVKANGGLQEEEETQLPFTTNEGEILKVGETYIYVGKIAENPRTIVTSEDEVRNIKVSLTNCLPHACYFKVLDPEFINRGFKDITINGLEQNPENISKHIHNN